MKFGNIRLSRSVERVSSGLRINRGVDDPAGLQISESLRSDLGVLRRNIRSVGDAASLLNTADRALDGIFVLLTRLREVAGEALLGTVGSTERQAFQLEFNSLRNEIDRISDTADFNDLKLIGGSLASTVAASRQILIQVGLDNSSSSRINLNMEIDLAAVDAASLNVDATAVSTADAALTALGAVDSAISTVNRNRSKLGAVQNRLSLALSNLAVVAENLQVAESSIRDTDFPQEIARLTRSQILVSGANAVLSQGNLVSQSVTRLLEGSLGFAVKGSGEFPEVARNSTGNPPLRAGETLKTSSLDLGNAVAGLRLKDEIGFLGEKFKTPPLPSSENLEKKEGSSRLKVETLEGIRNSLQELGSAVSTLRRPGVLNTRSAKSSRPEIVEAAATRESPLGKFTVKPQRAAAGNVLVSNAQTSAFAPLGLSGGFIINGARVVVESSDSLFDIKNKINFGEDLNQNQILDPAEDFNGNNVAEILSVNPSESGPGVFVIEDVNGNGILDPAEDANNNKRLDGGILETKVSASISKNRLVLSSLTGGASSIDLLDDDNILLDLGFFELNFKGFPVRRERQLDVSVIPAKELNQTRQKAQIEVDGQTFTANTNIFDGAVQGTRLSLKKASNLEARIEVFTDTGKAADQIKDLFDRFNKAIGKINAALADSTLFARDPEIQRIRNNLVVDPQRRIRKIQKENRDLARVQIGRENQNILGLEVLNAKKNIVQEVAVTRVVQSIKSRTSLTFKNTGRDILRRLVSIGIQTREDDTVEVDPTRLKRALAINFETVSDVLNNPGTGLLSQLDRRLSRILAEGLGDIDLKRGELEVQAGALSALAEQFKLSAQNETFRDSVQNLIGVA